jgi:hypothetical protein
LTFGIQDAIARSSATIGLLACIVGSGILVMHKGEDKTAVRREKTFAAFCPPGLVGVAQSLK